MVKKILKSTKPDKSNNIDNSSSGAKTQDAEQQIKTLDAEQQIKTLIEKGKSKGFLTYEQMNKELPDEAISPARLDRLLAALDEMDINLIDEADLKKQPQEGFEAPQGKIEAERNHLKEDKLLEKELVGEGAVRRIDDPVRMYLTQMGEIPLLTRKSEIDLARKIELTRMAFRRKMVESDYCARNALEILRQVQEGTLSFDRTMKTSTAENMVRSVIKKRLILLTQEKVAV